MGSKIHRRKDADPKVGIAHDSEILPGTPVGPFRLLYQFPGESLSEIQNATVHGYICVALAPTATGYRLYWAVYVLPVSWLTRPYLLAIEPFRRFIVYPALLRRIRRAWLARYGDSGQELDEGELAP